MRFIFSFVTCSIPTLHYVHLFHICMCIELSGVCHVCGIVFVYIVLLFHFYLLIWLPLWICIKWSVSSFSLSAAGVWLAFVIHFGGNPLQICCLALFFSSFLCKTPWFGHSDSVAATIMVICPMAYYHPMCA